MPITEIKQIQTESTRISEHGGMAFAGHSTKNNAMRGGARKGAGRKKGSGAGRRRIAKSIYMLKEQWKEVDAIRGKDTRSAFICRLVEFEISEKKAFQKIKKG